MLKKYLFASLTSIWFVQVLQRYLCLFCTRGAAVPLCHRIIVTPRTTLCPPPAPGLPFSHEQLSNPKGDYLATLIADKRFVLHPTNSQGNSSTSGYRGQAVVG